MLLDLLGALALFILLALLFLGERIFERGRRRRALPRPRKQLPPGS
ncbi:MAG TPA: hypothetical protein VEU77_01220 [Candidatus Acidoferrales bacterium]|nr:hypothetical protein [Candidatus Acidoferrales bacterium]